ncbi:hypothetical protein FrCorBMG51_10055, partial [Protofrankia coriariae]
PADRLACYSTVPELLPTLITLTDRQIIYGGDGIAAQLPELPTLTLHGPGRGCALVPADHDPQAAADWLTPLVAGNSGRFCKNVRTVLCAGDPAPVARALGARLDAIGIQPPDSAHPQAAIPDPVMAPRIAELAHRLIQPADEVVTTRPLLHRHGPLVFLAPTLIRLADPGTPDAPHPLVGRELPFPFAAVLRAGPALADAVQQRSLFVHTMPGGPSPDQGVDA